MSDFIPANGATMFRMVASFYADMADCENAEDATWVVNASMKRSRGGRKVSVSLTAENLVTHDLFTYPQDHAMITSVMPDEFWPSFIKDLSAPVALAQPMLAGT